jgi:hypothetical protein
MVILQMAEIEKAKGVIAALQQMMQIIYLSYLADN